MCQDLERTGLPKPWAASGISVESSWSQSAQRFWWFWVTVRLMWLHVQKVQCQDGFYLRALFFPICRTLTSVLSLIHILPLSSSSSSSVSFFLSSFFFIPWSLSLWEEETFFQVLIRQIKLWRQKLSTSSGLSETPLSSQYLCSVRVHTQCRCRRRRRSGPKNTDRKSLSGRWKGEKKIQVGRQRWEVSHQKVLSTFVGMIKREKTSCWVHLKPDTVGGRRLRRRMRRASAPPTGYWRQ